LEIPDKGGREETPVRGGENVILISVPRNCGLKKWRKSHSQELLIFRVSLTIIAVIKQEVIPSGQDTSAWMKREIHE